MSSAVQSLKMSRPADHLEQQAQEIAKRIKDVFDEGTYAKVAIEIQDGKPKWVDIDRRVKVR